MAQGCWSVGSVCATSYSWTTGPHWGAMESPQTAAGTRDPATPTRPRRWRRWAARARRARRPSRCPAAARQQLRWLGAAPASMPQPALAAQAGAPRAPSPPAAAAEAGLPERERAALVAAQRAALVAAQPGRASLDGLPAPPWPWKASGRAAAGLPSRPRGWRCGAASRCARGAPAAALTRSGEGRAALEQPASACAALAAR